MIKIPDKPCDNVPDDIPDEMLIRILRCSLGEENSDDEERYLSCKDCPIFRQHGRDGVNCDKITFYLFSKRFVEMQEQYEDAYGEGFNEGYKTGMGGLRMSKPIWLICGDQSLALTLEERLHSAEDGSGSHCPPDRNDENGWSCRKVYHPHGCCGCWAEWCLKNIEFVKDGVPE